MGRPKGSKNKTTPQQKQAAQDDFLSAREAKAKAKAEAKKTLAATPKKVDEAVVTLVVPEKPVEAPVSPPKPKTTQKSLKPTKDEMGYLSPFLDGVMKGNGNATKINNTWVRTSSVLAMTDHFEGLQIHTAGETFSVRDPDEVLRIAQRISNEWKSQ